MKPSQLLKVSLLILQIPISPSSFARLVKLRPCPYLTSVIIVILDFSHITSSEAVLIIKGKFNLFVAERIIFKILFHRIVFRVDNNMV